MSKPRKPKPVVLGTQTVARVVNRLSKNTLIDMVLDTVNRELANVGQLAEFGTSDERVIASLQKRYVPVARTRGIKHPLDLPDIYRDQVKAEQAYAKQQAENQKFLRMLQNLMEVKAPEPTDVPQKYMARLHGCSACRHLWIGSVVLSADTQNLSGEKTSFCPLCGKRTGFTSRAYTQEQFRGLIEQLEAEISKGNHP